MNAECIAIIPFKSFFDIFVVNNISIERILMVFASIKWVKTAG